MTDRPLEDATLETVLAELRDLRTRNERLEARVADLERRVADSSDRRARRRREFIDRLAEGDV